jgi:hypothetical protein
MVSRLSGRGVRRDRALASPRRPAKSPLRSSMRDENGDMFVDSDRLVIREVTVNYYLSHIISTKYLARAGRPGIATKVSVRVCVDHSARAV